MTDLQSRLLDLVSRYDDDVDALLAGPDADYTDKVVAAVLEEVISELENIIR